MKQQRIFLIDDDKDDRSMLCEALAKVASHHDCYTADSGLIALDMIADESIAIPDIILLDLNMPVVDGWQCLAAIKATPRYANLPVIIYSTSSNEEDIKKALDCGALCYFTKPYLYSELVQQLQLLVTHLENGNLQGLGAASKAFVFSLPS